MKPNVIFALFLMALILPTCRAGQVRASSAADREPSATVEVLAFDSRGSFLGSPVVEVFESQDGKNLASTFRDGVAKSVPFGVYRIAGYLTGYFSETRYVYIYQRRTTVILGLTIGHEISTVAPVLHGHVVSHPSNLAKKIFIKACGVFSNVAVESSIDINGGFDLAGLSWGIYLLLVISEDGILASRTISLPYIGPLEIAIAPNNAVPGTH